MCKRFLSVLRYVLFKKLLSINQSSFGFNGQLFLFYNHIAGIVERKNFFFWNKDYQYVEKNIVKKFVRKKSFVYLHLLLLEHMTIPCVDFYILIFKIYIYIVVKLQKFNRDYSVSSFCLEKRFLKKHRELFFKKI